MASSAPGASPSAAAVCADASAFRASVATLTSLKLVEVGTSGVKSAVADVKTSAEALLASGKDVLGPPLTDLLTAVSGLEATLASLGNQSGLGSALSAIRASITEVKTSATALDQTLTSTCPGQ